MSIHRKSNSEMEQKKTIFYQLQSDKNGNVMKKKVTISMHAPSKTALVRTSKFMGKLMPK